MPHFDKEIFKKNKLFLIISVSIIGIFLILSLFIKNSSLKEEDLSLNGKSDISKLVINEISSNNNGTLMAPDGGIYDWVEIYNGKSKDVNLTNYSLSDTITKIKWVFPEGTIIKSNSYLVIFLSGKTSKGLIANFKLSSSGSESLILRDKKKEIVDAVKVKSLSSNQVMGRDLNGGWHIYTNATPGFLNTLEGYNAFIKSLTPDK